MATKKATTPEYLKTVDQKIEKTIATAGKLYDTTYEVTDTLVDEAYRAGNEWNKILQKAVKGGVKIYGKQQDIALDAIEGIISQYGKGAQRFQKLVGFNILKEVKAKTAEAKDAIENAYATVSDKIEHTMQDVEAKAKSTVEDAKKTVATAKKNLEEVASQMEDKATKASATPKKATKKVIKKAALKAKATKAVATKKVASVTKASTKTITPKIVAKVTKVTKLTAINGIGPKTMSILATADIKTIAQLGNSTKTIVDGILEGKGKIYATVNTQEWINEAKKMAK